MLQNLQIGWKGRLTCVSDPAGEAEEWGMQVCPPAVPSPNIQENSAKWCIHAVGAFGLTLAFSPRRHKLFPPTNMLANGSKAIAQMHLLQKREYITRDFSELLILPPSLHEEPPPPADARYPALAPVAGYVLLCQILAAGI